MKKVIFVITLGVLFLATFNQAHAKWWIFGKTEDIPEIANFFIGGIDVTTVDGKELILDDSNLEADSIVIKGFATKGQAPLAIVKISLDNGVTWEDVNIQADSFIYQFKPIEDKEYQIKCKVLDTVGKESDLRDIPSFVLIYRSVDLNEIIEQTLLSLIEEYKSKNLNGFMDLISEAFVGDLFALEEAIQSDFRLYDNINMDITIQQVNKSGNKAVVDFDFNWSAIKKSDGSIINPSRGKTSYTFIQEQKEYKLSSMKAPIIFGISEASEIVTTSTSSIVDDTADVFASEDTYSTLDVSTATLNDGEGIDFSTETVAAGTGDVIYNSIGTALDTSGSAAAINVYDATGIALSDVTIAPSASAEWRNDGYSFAGLNYVFVVRESTSGPYAAFKITAGGEGGASMTIDYKYQSDGSTNLR